MYGEERGEGGRQGHAAGEIVMFLAFFFFLCFLFAGAYLIIYFVSFNFFFGMLYESSIIRSMHGLHMCCNNLTAVITSDR